MLSFGDLSSGLPSIYFFNGTTLPIIQYAYAKPGTYTANLTISDAPISSATGINGQVYYALTLGGYPAPSHGLNISILDSNGKN